MIEVYLIAFKSTKMYTESEIKKKRQIKTRSIGKSWAITWFIHKPKTMIVNCTSKCNSYSQQKPLTDFLFKIYPYLCIWNYQIFVKHHLPVTFRFCPIIATINFFAFYHSLKQSQSRAPFSIPLNVNMHNIKTKTAIMWRLPPLQIISGQIIRERKIIIKNLHRIFYSSKYYSLISLPYFNSSSFLDIQVSIILIFTPSLSYL